MAAPSMLVRSPRIAHYVGGFIGWSGGIDFLRHVIEATQAVCPQDCRLIVPAPGVQSAVRAGLLPARNAVARVFGASTWTPPPIPSAAEVITRLGLTAIETRVEDARDGARGVPAAARALGVDAILPSFEVLPRASPPWVGYVFDFQHRHLPELFSARERAYRDRSFGRMLQRAPAVIVNARAVRDDIALFYPGSESKVFALPFAPWARQPVPAEAVQAAQRRHGTGSTYFAICNQFWVHKDHATAFRAFRDFLDRIPDSDVRLVCTGNLHDHRAPRHGDVLRRLLSDLDLADRVLMPGLVDKDDQLALLQGSLALVQPTRFEGGPGGGATYDAVSLGVPVLLSDIPVNREVDIGHVRYFGVGAVAELAACMTAAYEAGRSGRPPETPFDVCSRRLQDFGRVLLEALECAGVNTMRREI